MKRMLHITMVLVASLLFSAPVMAQTNPTAFLKSVDKKLKPLLDDTENNKTKIIKIMNNMMDFEALGKASLGKHWADRSAEEQKDFIDTLHAVIEQNMVTRLGSSKDHVIAYQSQTIDGQTAAVVTTVSAGTGPRAETTEIEYKMQRAGKRWVVVDMVTDGVSLVSNYRSQFNKIITNDGFEALMKKMKDKLAK